MILRRQWVPWLIFLVALRVSFPMSWLVPACMPSLATLLCALIFRPSWKCLHLPACSPSLLTLIESWAWMQTVMYMSLLVYLAALNFAKQSIIFKFSFSQTVKPLTACSQILCHDKNKIGPSSVHFHYQLQDSTTVSAHISNILCPMMYLQNNLSSSFQSF